MPFYEFYCPECGVSYERQSRTPIPCALCATVVKRRYSFTFRMPTDAHYNSSVGEYVRNDREFRDALKRKSEANSVATGIDHNYVPVDPYDTRSLGVTDEGLVQESQKQYFDKVSTG